MGKLYVVATPIGNLEDITLRALRVLREVPLIAAEDTRTTGRLLAHYHIETPMISCFEHNELARADHLLSHLEREDLALVSEAGMPGISDPGYRLVTAAIRAGIEVVPIPGPSALTTALAVSGLPTDTALYLGFLPRKTSHRRGALAAVAKEPHTLVVFESPHRLLRSLADIRDVLGDRRIAIGRELTKLHEEVIRGRVSELIGHFSATPPRGEFTLVIEGTTHERERWPESQVREALARLLREGARRKDAARRVATWSGWSTREVYDLHEGARE